MPNICTTNYVIEGKKEELDALYQKMKELQEMEQPLVENNLGPTWLGCLVKALGKNPEDVLCRGIWIELERQDNRLQMTFETAWTPCYEVTQLMKTIFHRSVSTIKRKNLAVRFIRLIRAIKDGKIKLNFIK